MENTQTPDYQVYFVQAANGLWSVSVRAPDGSPVQIRGTLAALFGYSTKETAEDAAVRAINLHKARETITGTALLNRVAARNGRMIAA